MSHHPTGWIEKSLSLLIVAFLLWLAYPLSRGGGRFIIILILPLVMIWAPSMMADLFIRNQNENSIRRYGWIGLLLLAIPSAIALILLE